MRGTQREYVVRLRELARVKSEFIAVASHELRGPVANFRLAVELLERDVFALVPFS